MTGGNAFDRGDGYSGQDYDRTREAAEGAKLPAGTVAQRPDDAAPPDEDLPPDAGRRAFFDPRTGEVRGSGAGAGGGNPGEDYDSDAAAGDGFPQTGKGSDQP
ncbi:MAG: hypothetical protein E7773_04550 [Sphingomonas sp.]|uniref:hypothetical protein n=1 Tax=Sphingomonas sp. TaxID=28214 RepID=UPI001201F481|nr:hypothetical protein [Sphingomonas sp.]THD37303.1 MAG: hypothetical protein E7773_04550 [Sphingomonas sp.]